MNGGVFNNRCLIGFMLSIVLGSGPSIGRADELTYSPSTQPIVNPERGFYRFRSLTEPFDYSSVRTAGQTLIYGQVIASAFRDKPLSDAFLAKIQAGFDEARSAGVKVKFRLAYNDGIAPDAPKDVVLQHIQQLQPLWELNKDVLYVLDAGFIGAWGEWHSSTNNLTSSANRHDILQAILQALPTDRMVGVRTPSYKRDYLTGSPSATPDIADEENAFSASDVARIGHLNDCFLSSSNDVGTYNTYNGLWPLERDLAYIGGESQYLPFGGETCGLAPRNESAAAIAEMAKLHIDYLNLDYHPDVIQRWRNDGAFDEIDKRLGYRFELQRANVPAAIRPGSTFELNFTVDNKGFGELFNARPLEVALRNNATGETHTAPLVADVRRWTGGERNVVGVTLAVPSSLPTGDYALGLWMPDAATTLRSDPRYAVQFANVGTWDGLTGINWLSQHIALSSTAAGTLYRDLDQFREVTDPSTLRKLGDVNGDGTCDVTDLDALSQAIRSGSVDAAYDVNQDAHVDDADHSFWITTLRPTPVGDANLDGQFNSADLVQVFQMGRYEDVAGSADVGWGEGDWSGDGRFDSYDLVVAFQSGLYEAGSPSEPQPTSVPEPVLGCYVPWVVASLLGYRRRRKQLGGTGSNGPG